MGSIYTFHNEADVAALADADQLLVYDASTGRTGSCTVKDVTDYVSAGMTTLTGDTTLTAATHGGKTLLLGEVGGNAALAVTLPAATGSGVRFRFVVSVVNTSGYTIKVVGNDIMSGNIVTNSTGDTPDLAQPWPTAADSDTITLNGTTTGGAAIGDFIEVQDILADNWFVFGHTTSSGSEATPFSAAV
jgi:hypothetical protein